MARKSRRRLWLNMAAKTENAAAANVVSMANAENTASGGNRATINAVVGADSICSTFSTDSIRSANKPSLRVNNNI